MNVYKNETNNLLYRIGINIPDTLKKIVLAEDGDPMFYLGYELNANQLSQLNNYLIKEIEPDFKL